MPKYLSKEKIVDSVVQGAEETIFLLTGHHCLLQITLKKVDPRHEVYELLDVVAEALALDSRAYKMGKRRIYTDLRCIAAMMIERIYPKFKLEQVCEILGLALDGHRVSGYRKRGQDYIDTKEKEFVSKYEKALTATELWVAKNMKKNAL